MYKDASVAATKSLIALAVVFPLRVMTPWYAKIEFFIFINKNNLISFIYCIGCTGYTKIYPIKEEISGC